MLSRSRSLRSAMVVLFAVPAMYVVACREVAGPVAVPNAACRATGVAPSLSVTPRATTVTVHDTLGFQVSIADSAGTMITCPVSYSYDKTAFAILNSDRFIATAAGSWRIVVNAVGRSVVAEITVLAASTQPQYPSPKYVPRQYTVYDLTADVGDSAIFGRVNDQNHVIGNIGGQGVLWRASSVTTLTGCDVATHINGRDEVTCVLKPIGAGVWENGVVTPIRDLADRGASRGVTLDINDAGDIGTGWQSADCESCVSTIIGGRFSSVANVLPSPLFPYLVTRFNNAGELLVSSVHGMYSNSVYVVRDGAIVSQFDVGLGATHDMNDSGWIAASGQAHPGNSEAIVLTPTKGIVIGFGAAYSINNASEVVGQLELPSYGNPATNPDRALVGPFYWTEKTGVELLAFAAIDSHWTITKALQINNRGSILAMADNATEHTSQHYVLLVPTTLGGAVDAR